MTVTYWDEERAKQFGRRLTKAREAKSLSLQGLADRISVSKATVGHWETGVRTIKLHDLVAVCTALKVSADELLFGVLRWPFEGIDFDSVAGLDKRDIDKLEGGLALTAAQLGIEIKRHAA